MALIYDLRKDEGMHINNARPNPPKSGIMQTFGRFLSPEWWAAFDSGKIRVDAVEGLIMAYEDPPKSAWPEVVVSLPDSKTERFLAQANQREDYHEYKCGRPIRVEFADLELDANLLGKNSVRVVTRVEIETKCEQDVHGNTH